MITIKNVMEWLKTKDATLNGVLFNSSIDANKDQCVGVYARRNGPLQPEAIGKESHWGVKPMTLLVHWSRNADTCETKALDIWLMLRDATTTEQIGNKACWISARSAPVAIGRDDRLVFEQVVDFDIYYRKG